MSIKSSVFIFAIAAAIALDCSVRAELIDSPFDPPADQLPRLEKSYIAPNEHMDAFYKPLTQGMEGAGISVGTFRSFQRILFGNFSWFFMVDVDPQVVKFNRLNYEAIMSSKNLKQYLENFPTAYSHRFGHFPEDFDGSAYTNPSKNTPLLNWTREHLPDYGIGRVYLPLADKNHSPLKSKEYLDALYFNHEDAFQQLKSKLAKTKVMIVQGSVTSPKLGMKLRSFLRKRKTDVSLLDLSNVLDYVVPEKETATPGEKHAVLEAKSFIEALPFSKNAKVFLTAYYERPAYREHFDFRGTREEDLFWYYATTPRGTLDILDGKKSARIDVPALLTSSSRCGGEFKKLSD